MKKVFKALFFGIILGAVMVVAIESASAETGRVNATANFIQLTQKQIDGNEYIKKNCPNSWRWYYDRQTKTNYKGCK